jgi:vacuolar-type H+-ATPase subunit H
MKREDILLALKEAEEKTRGMVEEARKASERNLTKARQDAALRIEEGKAKTAIIRDNLLAAKLLSMEEEANIIRHRGTLRAERLRQVSEDTVERTIDTVIKAFERYLDV